MDSCKNHPDRLARRRCYFCKSFICAECQIRIEGHIFCSSHCHKEWSRTFRRERVRKNLRRWERWINPLLWWRYPPFLREAWAKRVTALLWLNLLLVLLLSGSVVFLFRERSRGSHLFLSGGTKAEHLQGPSWVTPPTNSEGIIRGSYRGGNVEGILLRNGVPIRIIPPHSSGEIREPAGLIPTVYGLFPLREYRSQERWVGGGALGGSVEQVPSARGIALTFDGGSSADQVEKVLSALRQGGVRGTFFLTGEFIARYPDLTRWIVASGHDVGNHTFSHPHLTLWSERGVHRTRPGVTREFLQWELLRTEHLFAQITGAMMIPYWRAPYGEVNEEIIRYAEEIGYRHIGWTRKGGIEGSLDLLDWVSDPKSPLYLSGREMLAKVLNLVKKPEFRGAIVLMHLGIERKGDSIQDYLRELIGQLREEGIPILTVRELLLEGERGEGSLRERNFRP